MPAEEMINYRDAQGCAFSWICTGSDLVEEDKRSGCGLNKNFVDFSEIFGSVGFWTLFRPFSELPVLTPKDRHYTAPFHKKAFLRPQILT